MTDTIALRELVDGLALVAVTVTVWPPVPLVGLVMSQVASSLIDQLIFDVILKIVWLFAAASRLRLVVLTAKVAPT